MKTEFALSAIGIAAVLMLVLAPVTANHQTFGHTYSYHGPLAHYNYFHIHGYKHCFAIRSIPEETTCLVK